MSWSIDRVLKYIVLAGSAFIIATLIVAPPAHNSTPIYRLADGHLIQCKNYMREECGLTLTGCENGSTLYCQTNVEVLRKANDPR